MKRYKNWAIPMALVLLVSLFAVPLSPAISAQEPEGTETERWANAPFLDKLPIGPLSESQPLADGGLLYLTSLDSGNTTFSVYDPAADTWTSLAGYDTGCQMAVSTEGQLYAYRRSPAQIEVYDPAVDVWSYVMAAPGGASGSYCNLEITRDGEFLYTQANGTTLYYTSGGVWNTLALPFTTNVMGDYDPTTHQYVVGEYGTVHAHMINLDDWTITDFLLGPGSNGEYARFSSILGNRYYYQTGSDPIRSYDLSNPSLPGQDHGVSPGFYCSSAADRINEVIYTSALDGNQLFVFDPAAGTLTPLASHGSIGNHSSIAYAVPMGEMGYLNGTVYDATTMAPIEGATVTADAFSADTDASGYYTMTAMVGVYTMTAEHIQYTTGITTPIEVFTDMVTTVDFYLTPRGLLWGYVTDLDTGLPLEATVDVAGWGSVDTNPGNGYYEIYLDEGTYNVTASAPDHAPRTATVDIVSGMDTRQDFALPAAVVFLPSPIHVTVPWQATYQMDATILNRLPNPYDFEFAEMPGGFVPMAEEAEPQQYAPQPDTAPPSTDRAPTAPAFDPTAPGLEDWIMANPAYAEDIYPGNNY
ncbi:MAG: carboxypeptidase regulatory-like domain-containing protein, partial [Anaerolineae bacterium]|nr:carboxypeptidase regulatory-like domain-containing protein [Anaerolineae bacterium]